MSKTPITEASNRTDSTATTSTTVNCGKLYYRIRRLQPAVAPGSRASVRWAAIIPGSTSLSFRGTWVSASGVRVA